MGVFRLPHCALLDITKDLDSWWVAGSKMLRKPSLGPLCDSEKGNSGKINTSSVDVKRFVTSVVQGCFQ